MSRRRILITGGMGYVGGRVAQTLAETAHFQLALGTRQAQRPPAWLPGSDVVLIDWSSPESIRAVCEGVDIVLHLAAMNEIESARDPAGALQVNGVNSIRLLQASQASGVERFVYLSTAHVYGAPLAGRIDESTCPRPVHPYATSHRAAEDAVLAAHDEKRLTGVVLRLSNAFGAPAHPGVNRWTLLVNDLCRQAATDRRLVLRSAGLQRRDFVTLHDVGRALAHVLELPPQRLGDGILNIGGAWAPRVIDVAELVQARCSVVLGFTPAIVRPEPAAGEMTLDLDYRIDRLLATGFALTGDRDAEIDATLRLCCTAAGGRVE
jgi:UDP-glucose 4-epimerase